MSSKKNYDEIEFKEISRSKKKRKKKHYFLRFIIFAAVMGGLGVFLSSDFFQIKTIEVEGNSYYTDDEVITISNAHTGGNLFWGTGSSEIKDRLSKDPYFADVTIKRKLPGTVIIKVDERVQTAAIQYADNYVVIGLDGTVLRKNDVDPQLPLISGLTISKLEMGESIGVEETETLNTTLKMLDTMNDGDIYFKKIDVSGVIIKAYIYDTLVVKGTPKQMAASIGNGDLQKVVNNLFKNNTTRGTINLGEQNYMSFSPSLE